MAITAPQLAPVIPGTWTFWADTIVGATPLGPVQPHDFTFTRVLNDAGAATAVLPLDSDALEPARLLRLWSWRLWVFYAGVPVWCGVPTGITDDGSATVSVTLTELHGYLAKRQFDGPAEIQAHEDVPPVGMTWTQVEQTALAANLAFPVADVGVTIVTTPGPAVQVRDRTYQPFDGDSRLSLIQDLTSVINGPEFRAEYAMNAGTPAATLHIAHPRVGGSTGLGVTVPGTAVAYSSAWDADNLRTRTFAVGDQVQDTAGNDVTPFRVNRSPQPDLPRLDAVDQWQGVTLMSTLQEYADSSAASGAAPSLALTVQAGETAPPLTAYNAGDDVTVHAVTPLLAGGGLDVTGKLASESVNCSAGTVDWTITITSPPPAPRVSIWRRIGQVERIANGIFRRNPVLSE